MRCPHCNAEFDMPRDPNISHSAFGQWIKDNIPNTFFWADVDGISYKRATRILRVIEEKQPGQELKDSQKKILPLLAKGIDYLISLGIVHEQSGVFIIHTESPYITATVSQIYDSGTEGPKFTIQRDELKSFIAGLETT